MAAMGILFTNIVIVPLVFKFCFAKQSREIYCGACIALLDEMNWKIDSVDKKSTVQVGSFRIDSNGNQQLHEIPLARSELHLSELLEDVCSAMSDYGEVTDSDGSKTYIRASTRDGSVIKLDSLQVSASVHGQLKFACETLIEEHEEELIEAFQEDDDSIKSSFCVDSIEVCEWNNVTEHRQVMDSATVVTPDSRIDEVPNTSTDDPSLTLGTAENDKEDL